MVVHSQGTDSTPSIYKSGHLGTKLCIMKKRTCGSADHSESQRKRKERQVIGHCQ